MNFMFPLILIMCRGDSVWKINISETRVKCDEEGGYSIPFELGGFGKEVRMVGVKEGTGLR